MAQSIGDVSTTIDEEFVATVEIQRGPNNFFDIALIRDLAETYESLEGNPRCRAIVLCSVGKHFCAGADFTGQSSAETVGSGDGRRLYAEAVRLFAACTPVVAAIQGAAIGGGLGLACSADLRVASSAARFSANFGRIGLHQGFGLSVTLPRIVGPQHATDMLLTGRRVSGGEALSMALCDQLVEPELLRQESHRLAVAVASAAPLAIESIRRTLRGDLVDQVRRATEVEDAEQEKLRLTNDWREGIAASKERRPPVFMGN